MPRHSSRAKRRTKASPAVARAVQRKTQREKIPQEWIPDLELLARILERTRNINIPLREVLQPEPSAATSLRFATVSSALSLDDLDDHPGPRGSAYKLKVVKRKTTRAKLRKQFVTDLEIAADEGAQLVCFNELAYPTPIDQGADQEFQREVKSVVESHSLVVVAGSFHDPSAGYNLTRIFAPGKGLLTHAKLTSAAKVGELIRTPSGRRLRYYQTAIGTVGILVCLDAYEPSLFLRLMQKNSEFTAEESIRLILVPSFSPQSSKRLLQSCKDLSFVTGSVVAFVNCQEIRPHHKVFIAGEEMPRRSIKKHGYTRKKLSNSVVLHSLTERSVRHLREQARDKYSVVLRYLLDEDRKFRSDIIY